MRNYKVTITETYQKEVYVEAVNKADALEIVQEGYHDAIYYIDSDDHMETVMKAKIAYD